MSEKAMIKLKGMSEEDVQVYLKDNFEKHWAEQDRKSTRLKSSHSSVSRMPSSA